MKFEKIKTRAIVMNGLSSIKIKLLGASSRLVEIQDILG
jgi:hypothetical protein